MQRQKQGVLTEEYWRKKFDSLPKAEMLVCPACGGQEFSIGRGPVGKKDGSTYITEVAKCFDCQGQTIVTHMRSFTLEEWKKRNKGKVTWTKND